MKILKWPIRSFQLSREKNLPRIEDSLKIVIVRLTRKTRKPSANQELIHQKKKKRKKEYRKAIRRTHNNHQIYLYTYRYVEEGTGNP